jgi:hypothetical protein
MTWLLALFGAVGLLIFAVDTLRKLSRIFDAAEANDGIER